MNEELKLFKQKYFTLAENSNMEKTHLWLVMLRIFSLLITTFLPIIITTIFIFISPIYDKTNKSNSLEAIGFTLNIVFIIIYYTIVFIGQISSKLKPYINNSNTKEERNNSINAGLYVLFTIISILLLVFTVVSIVFAKVRAIHISKAISQNIVEYMLIMLPIIIFNMVSNFYINTSFAIDGVKSNWLLFSLYPIALLEIMMAFLFSIYINTEHILVILMLPTLIISFIKMIAFSTLFYVRTNYFQEHKFSLTKVKENKFLFSFSRRTFRKILKRCELSIWFAISLMATLVIQSLMISFAYTIKNAPSYLLTQGENQFYVLLFVKIITYDLLYLIFLASRSFNISMLEQEYHDKKEFHEKIKRKMFLRKINYFIITFLVALSCCLYFAIDALTKTLFKNLDWYNQVVQDGIFKGKSYTEVIPFLVKQSYLTGIFAFFLVEHSINNRIIFFKTDKANKKLFALVILSYALSISVLFYVFGFLLNKIFIGLTGFLIAFGCYGLFSLVILLFFEAHKSNKNYLIYFSNETPNMSSFKFFFKKWGIDLKIKKNKKFDFYFYLITTLFLLGSFAWIIFELWNTSQFI